MAVIVWPAGLLRPVEGSFFIRNISRSGGVSLNGVEQVLTSTASWWEISLTLSREFDGERLKAFEAYISRMRGRQNVAAIPLCDPYRYGAKVSPLQQPWSDGTYFSDGTGWVDGTASQPMTVVNAAGVGSRFLTFKLTQPVRPALRLGDMFSINGFLYRVTSAGGNDIYFEPPLRQAIPAGQVIQTDPPVFYGRFATDDEGRRSRELMRWGGQTTLTLIEAFDR
ncbi:hypothetical protein [Paracoccus suum]|nr:hypothetical protein [Paracoccus suum]